MTSPGVVARYARGIAWRTEFPPAYQVASASSVVDFDRVRVVLHHSDGTVALDTLIDFPAGADSETVSLDVKLLPTAPASGEPLSLNLAYINAAGDTVFKGGPVGVTATPTVAGQPPPPPVRVPVSYSGPGASAVAVQISPRTGTVTSGGSFVFSAVAVDGAGTPVPNTPIVWNTLDPSIASVPSAASGTVIAGNVRGTARIVAQLLTGPTDQVSLSVLPHATTLSAQSGNGQSALAGATLANPLVAFVAGSDGLGVGGVTVTFAVASGGGSVGSATAVTNDAGLAQTTWKLGGSVGTQSVTATAGTLAGSPLTFTATAKPAGAVRLAITTQPANAAAGATIAPVTVVAQTAAGDTASSFTGAVTLAIASGPAGATLGGTSTVNAVGGVATFTTLQITKSGTGYSLVASSSGLAGATTNTFDIAAGPASKLAFTVQPLTVAVGSPIGSPAVTAQDQYGNAVIGFTGSVSVALGSNPAAATLGGTTSASAVAGVATFGSLTVNRVASGYTLTASATGLASATSASFDAFAGGAANLVLISGGGQTGNVSAALSQPVVVQVQDGGGNGVAGKTVTFAVVTGGGSLSIASGVSDASGLVTTVWTLGPTVGAQSISATATGLAGSPLTIGATATTTLPHLTFTTSPAAAQVAGAAITPNVVVQARDASNNLVATFTGTVTLAIGTNPGGGTLSGTLSVAAVAGVASFGSLSIDKPGTGYTLTASSAGYTSGASTAFNETGGSVASTIVAPHLDTLTAIGATFGLSAQGKDNLGNNVAGTYTWVSRTPAVATVGATGTVTALTNGSSWVVATETGGTKDSALIVVQQRLATINVTPATKSIYLGASSPAFTASAVDGLGVALTVQPSFTWSTASSAIASITAGGVATGVGLGSTLVQATSGAVTGVATLNVVTRIKYIYVARDSAGFSQLASDTFTIAALGRSRSYKAFAYDSSLAVVPGITFTFVSSNAAVAAIDSTGTVTVRAMAAANGSTAISATAQGVTGSAALKVQQILTAIDLSPTTATIAVTGSTALLARGKDANGFFIPGGAFTFTSSSPANATVTATTGIVTGVANGSATIVAKDSATGLIASNSSVITIGGAVPAIISFGRDTLTVGRSGSTSVPVYLSKPNATAITVNLAVKDTFAFFSPASISIPAGSTSGNATLNGHNAGTTLVYASDGSGLGFTPDTAVLAVQATVRLASPSYTLVVNDQVSTQVLLSDPAPAGGTFITFSYGTAGRAQVSPDPAFIPAGQLAANLVILATGAGGTTITPAATGVNGTASGVSTSAAVLSVYPSVLRLGAGQYEPSDNVQSPQYLNNPVSVTLTSTDSNTVSAPSPVTIPGGLYYTYFNTTGKIPGAATLTASAPNWSSASMAVTVTTPHVGISGGTTLNTTSPASGFTVYAEDSTFGIHSRTSALAVTLSSSDPSVITVNTPALSIPAGSNSVGSGTVSPVGGGTAWLKVTASGHTSDSTLYTVVGPKLSLSWNSNLVGVGQTDLNVNVQGPNYVTAPLTVTITNPDSSVVGLPTSVIIPTNSYYVYFNVRGKAPGTERLIATAPGYQPDTAFYTVTTPRLVLSGGSTMQNFGPAQGFTVYPADSLRAGHAVTAPLTVTYSSTNPAVFTVSSGADTIQAGSTYANHVTVSPTGVGTAMLIATAPGYLPDTAIYTVVTPKLSFSFTHSYVGRRQFDSNVNLQTPNYLTAPLTVTFTQTRPTVDSLSSSTLNIPSGTYYQSFSYAGLSVGTDTIIASAPGYLPDTAVVTVTTPRLYMLGAGLPGSALTTSPPTTATVYVADSLNTVHYPLDTLVVSALSSNAGVLQPATSSLRVLKGAQYGQQLVTFTGPGSASVTYSDSANTGYLPVTTNTVAVTGPSLAISNSTPILGLRQNGGGTSANVQVANNVTGSPLVVSLVSSDPTVVTVPATVTIPVGQYYAYFQITAHDVVGTIQITATAAGYGGANTSVQVNQPTLGISTSTTLNTTSPRQTVNVYAYDARGAAGGAHYTNEDVAVTLASSSAGVGTIDSTTVVIAAGTQYNTHAQFIPGAAGTTTLSATDGRAAAYRYTTATQNVAVITPTLSLWGSALTLGIGQYQDQTVQTPDYQTSALTVSFSHLNAASTTPASVVIPQGLYYNNAVRVSGVSAGTDTVTASAPGHNSTKSAVVVAPGRIDQNNAWPSTLSLSGTDSVLVTVYPRDASSTIHYVSAATVFTLTGSANVSFSSGSAPITSITVPADANQVQFWVKGTSAGTSFVSISNANYSTFTSSITVTP